MIEAVRFLKIILIFSAIISSKVKIFQSLSIIPLFILSSNKNFLVFEYERILGIWKTFIFPFCKCNFLFIYSIIHFRQNAEKNFFWLASGYKPLRGDQNMLGVPFLRSRNSLGYIPDQRSWATLLSDVNSYSSKDSTDLNMLSYGSLLAATCLKKN